jgi:hypothetical protein
VWVGLKRELGAWTGDVVGVLSVRARWSAVVRGEGGAHRGSHGAVRERERAQSERFAAQRGQARGADRGSAREAEEVGADRSAPPGRGREGA